MNLYLLRALGLNEEADLLEAGLCPFCGQPPGPFRDELSEKEYTLSGLCQACQDLTFDDTF